MCYKKIKSLITILTIVFSTSFYISAQAQTDLSKDTGYTKVFDNSAGCSGFNLGDGTTQDNAKICAAECSKSEDCHGFSYNPINKGCRLKVTSFCMNQGDKELGYTYYTRNAKWSDTLDQEYIILQSGYQKVADGDCLEADLGNALAVADLSTCAAGCNRTTGCKGFSFSHTDKRCILKSVNECALSTRVRGYYQFYGKIK